MSQTVRVGLRKKRSCKQGAGHAFNWYFAWCDPFERYQTGKSAGRPRARSAPLSDAEAKTEKSREAARLVKIGELAEYARTGVSPEQRRRQQLVTWGAFVEQHLAGRRGRKNRTTPASGANRVSVKKTLDEFTELCSPPTPAAVTLEMVERFAAKLAADAASGIRKQGENTITRKLRELRTAMNTAIRHGYVQCNVVDQYGVGTVGARKGHPLQADESRRLFQACHSDRWRLFIALALNTGARLREVLGLTWERVQLLSGSRAVVTFRRRKTSDDHEVRVSGVAAELLVKAWREATKSTDPSGCRPADPDNVAGLYGDHPERQRAKRAWVFTTERGTQWCNNVLKEFKQIAIKADLYVTPLLARAGDRAPRYTSELTIHDLRKTVVSHGQNQHWSPFITCQVTGQTEAVAERNYSTAFDKTLWQASESLAELVA